MISKVVGIVLFGYFMVAVGFFGISTIIPLGSIPLPFENVLGGLGGYTLEWWRTKIYAMLLGMIGLWLLRR